MDRLLRVVLVAIVILGFAGCAKNPKKDFNEGLRLYEDGQTAEAVGKLEGAVEQDPDDPEAQHALAVAYTDLGRFKKALECYQRASELDLDEPLWQVGLGICHL